MDIPQPPLPLSLPRGASERTAVDDDATLQRKNFASSVGMERWGSPTLYSVQHVESGMYKRESLRDTCR